MRITTISSLFYSSYPRNKYEKYDFNSYELYIFWIKWSKLHRPKIKETFNSKPMVLFLIRCRKKLKIYKKLKIVWCNSNIPFIYNINLKFLKLKVVNIIYPAESFLKIPKLTSSSVIKYVGIDQTDAFEFQFLRKNKVYNKGRYSRCRQNYRTGVYMCMYLSIVSIFGLYYWFFKFSFNFTYLWWLFITFIGSIFLPKMVKFRLYEPLTVLNMVFDFFKWFLVVSKSIFFKKRG